MLAILYSLKTMESLQNGIETNFKGTPLFSMRTESLASLKSCCSIDVDAWCKRALTAVKIILIVDQLFFVRLLSGNISFSVLLIAQRNCFHGKFINIVPLPHSGQNVCEFC